MSEPVERRSMTRRGFLAASAAAAAGVAVSPSWAKAAGARGASSASDLRQLASLVRGPVVMRGDPQMPAAAELWNARFSWVVPRAVVFAADERDVQQTVKWAARTDTRLAARSGGHSYEGYSTTTSGVILDLGALSGIRVNPGERKASIGAGAELVEVYNGLAARGQTIPAGSCPTVGMAGLTLGGGVGFASRKWGTTSDNVLALRIVTADGRIRTVDRRRDEDLFWACRGGGGGNFGVVTAFLMRTYPAEPAATFQLSFAWENAVEVVRAWQDWAPFATDDLFSQLALTSSGGLGVSGQYFGSEADLPALLRPLTGAVEPTKFSTATRQYIEAVRWWAECESADVEACRRQEENPLGAVARTSFAGTSDYVRDPIPPGAVTALQRRLQARADSGKGGAYILFDSYGGAINRVSPTATAFAHRDMRYSIQYAGGWTQPENQRFMLGWLRGTRAAMRPHVTGSAYVNYIDSQLGGWERAYYGNNLERLADVKRRYDPEDVFRFAQAVPRSA